MNDSSMPVVIKKEKEIINKEKKVLFVIFSDMLFYFTLLSIISRQIFTPNQLHDEFQVFF